MKYLVKNSEGKVLEGFSEGGFIPPGYELVSQEELPAVELALAKEMKLSEVRIKRDNMLQQNDKLWLIASKKGQSTTALETDAETLRDLPELAEGELSELTSLEDIKSYDCFSGLSLSGSYE